MDPTCADTLHGLGQTWAALSFLDCEDHGRLWLPPHPSPSRSIQAPLHGSWDYTVVCFSVHSSIHLGGF